jgi:hypothetical protein
VVSACARLLRSAALFGMRLLLIRFAIVLRP